MNAEFRNPSETSVISVSLSPYESLLKFLEIMTIMGIIKPGGVAVFVFVMLTHTGAKANTLNEVVVVLTETEVP